MDLILWRHAEAAPGEPDLGRVLTPKGHKQAVKVAAWLDHHLPDSCRILVSPAERTQQTAQALGRKFETCPDLAPGVTVARALAATGWPSRRESVLIVGHQPWLGTLASFLLAGEEQPWSVKKGAVWWISNRSREGDSQTVLRAVIGPEWL